MSGFEEMLADPNEQFDRRGELLKSITEYANAQPCAASADPFPGPTPPPAEESARVASDAALLSAAAGRLERQVADGLVDPLFTGLVAWLHDAAQEAEMIGPNRFAVALARKIMGEGESA